MLSYQTAATLAVALCEQLKPYCDRIHIAGSIRRHKADVKDIEIVCLPKSNPVKNLFGDVIGREIEGGFVTTVYGLDAHVLKGSTSGRYMQLDYRFDDGRVNVDLFMPEATDFIRQYVIRTGSSDYVTSRIAWAWKRKGWCGTPDGLRLQKDCVERKSSGKSIWTCPVVKPTLPPVWETEQEFFEWLEVPFIHPSQRTIAVVSPLR